MNVIATPVAAEDPVAFPFVSGVGESGQIEVYRLQTPSPERIEAVYFFLEYDHALIHDLYVVRLVDPTNKVLFAQYTPLWNLD